MKSIYKKLKKGFTLVELLAVLVILAVIITLAIVIETKRIQQVRKKAFISKCHQYIKAADFHQVAEEPNDPTTYIFPGDTELSLKEKPDAGYITRDEEGRYELHIWNERLGMCAVKDYTDIDITISEILDTKQKCVRLSGEDEPVDESSLTEAEYQIAYHSNYDGGADTVIQVITKGTPTKLNVQPFTRSGYKFTKWTTKANGAGVIYADEELVTDPTQNKTMHLYANWAETNECPTNDNLIIVGKSVCKENQGMTVASGVVCKRATLLHQEKCTQTGTSFCAKSGYSESGTKGTDMITYGNCGTIGTLNYGDAFTCDVNGDGEFNEYNERFYYVNHYYNTVDKTFENDTAVLVYYNTVSAGVACNYNWYQYGYREQGPTKAMLQLPTTSQWPNVSLKNTSRTILAQNGKVMKTDYSYSGYAARLITQQELAPACGLSTGSTTNDGLASCNYILENTKYASSSRRNHGSFFENPDNYYSGHVWTVYDEYVAFMRTGEGSSYGVRPAIEVPMSKMGI